MAQDPPPPADLAGAWEREAGAWATWASTPGHDVHFEALTLPALLRALPAPGALTLDVGCGEGRVGAHLHARGHRLIGVDASPTLAALARERGVYEHVHVASAEAMPLRDGSADLAVANMVLMDLDDLEGAVREVARVLRPGGHFAATVVHPYGDLVADRGAGARDDYFASWRYADAIERDGLAMTFHSFHHPLARYVRAFTDAGLLLDRLEEPRMPAGLAATVPERWSRLPFLLVLRGVLGVPGSPA